VNALEAADGLPAISAFAGMASLRNREETGAQFQRRSPGSREPGTASVLSLRFTLSRLSLTCRGTLKPQRFRLETIPDGGEDMKAGALKRPWRRVAAVVFFLAGTAGLSFAAAQTSVDPTAVLLAELIRADTSNPPGRTAAVANLLAPRFRAAGFEVEIIPTPAPEKVHFIARLKGDGTKRPVLLAAHADVVGVESGKWTVDPFAGTIRDGYVYGRGAIDFKGGIAVFARAALMLAEHGVKLARDVIFVSEADEEGAGPLGAPWLAENHWPKIDCEFALNEGGWIVKDRDGRVQYVSISTADKISLMVSLTARGTSTHSSMPLSDNPIFTLARALTKLSEHRTAVALTPGTRRFFSELAKTSQGPVAGHFRNLTSDDPELVRRADEEISRDPLLNGIMRNTIAPTLMSAGFRGNVIPGSAEATVNVRVVPGTDPGDIIREFEQVIADPAVEVRLSSRVIPTPPVSSEDTDLFRSLERQARQAWPGAVVTSYVFQAGTDARAWRSRDVPVYGIYPYAIDADDLIRMHGNDERVRVESLKEGTEMIYQTLVEVAGQR
jgi:acetylornithine deacetylase/succinyl-diaminopimelate desuccinylase-like protein